LRLRIKIVDKTGDVELEFYATQRDLAKAQKWAKAFQTLFVDALMEDADLDITIARNKGNLNLVV